MRTNVINVEINKKNNSSFENFNLHLTRKKNKILKYTILLIVRLNFEIKFNNKAIKDIIIIPLKYI